MLAERPDVQVIGEVADGLEPVQKAELLEPDLVLLDIGYSQRNRGCSPDSQRCPKIKDNFPESGVLS